MAAASDLLATFSADGPLTTCLADFAPRAEQLAMAEAVDQAIRTEQNLIVEAGTGTGKTLAYLIPLLRAGRKAIISTRTRTLQDQLYHRDLPMIAKALGRPATVRLLKGRANYLCLHRLEAADGSTSDWVAGADDRSLRLIRNWAPSTDSGDIAELTAVPESSVVWSRVTSTVDNCLGNKCDRFDDCHVVAARQAAREADIVVVNHHLLMADLSLRDDGFGALLPGAEVVVLDEAHHFPDVAQGFFNVSLGTGQLNELLSDVATEAGQSGLLDTGLQKSIDAVRDATRSAQAGLPGRQDNVAWRECGRFASEFEFIGDALSELAENLGELDDAPTGLVRCQQRTAAALATVNAISGGDDETSLRWVRCSQRGFTANMTPLEIAGELGRLLESVDCTWIMTSATLAVGEDFAHFSERLGLAGANTRQIPSPFRYEQNARLFLPPNMPMPNSAEFTRCFVDAVLPLLDTAGGRCFLLFTSHRALREAAEHLTNECGDRYTLLVQGTAPRSALLEQFARLDNAVLLGTATFWEGVDIRGPQLVIVAIDRLPFASPGDPLLAARLDAIRAQGGNPFRDYQLPQAVLGLKQGVGRLIRDYSDYGVVVIGDPRITQKSYGRVFLASLPPMPVSRDIDEVCRFLAEREVT